MLLDAGRGCSLFIDVCDYILRQFPRTHFILDRQRYRRSSDLQGEKPDRVYTV